MTTTKPFGRRAKGGSDQAAEAARRAEAAERNKLLADLADYCRTKSRDDAEASARELQDWRSSYRHRNGRPGSERPDRADAD